MIYCCVLAKGPGELNGMLPSSKRFATQDGDNCLVACFSLCIKRTEKKYLNLNVYAKGLLF